ncbi:MAG: drug efflux transport system permease protein [Actinomycetota bacterium]|nr:drug efflux transport system permease protein [Actinomycetota bacterium]
MRALWIMTFSDLRLNLRNRSVLLFALVIPASLMTVLSITYNTGEATGLTGSQSLSPVSVAAAVPEGDRLGTTLLTALTHLNDLDIDVELTSADRARALAGSGEADLALFVPEGFTDAVRAGRGPTVSTVRADGTGAEVELLLSVIGGTLEQFHDGALAARAATAGGVPAAELDQVALQAALREPSVAFLEGRTSSEQLSATGALVAGQAGLFLFFTVGFGVLALVSERETGTWTRLCSLPLRPWTIVASKALVSYVLGVASTGVLLTVGILLLDVDFGAPLPIALLVLCAVAAGTSLMFVVARLARTAEQANLFQTALAMILGLAGGAFFPLSVSGPLDAILDLNPVAAFSRGLGITSGGGGPTDLGAPVAILLGSAAVTAALSLLLPDRGRAT